MPGAHYAGTLVVYIAAGLFSIFGPSVVALKLATYPFALGFVAGTFELGRRLGGVFVGAIAGLFVAVAPPLLVKYSQLAIGGHTETLAIGVWLVILTMELERRSSGPGTLRLTFLAGFLAGIAFWTLPAIVPCLLAIFGFITLHKPLW